MPAAKASRYEATAIAIRHDPEFQALIMREGVTSDADVASTLKRLVALDEDFTLVHSSRPETITRLHEMLCEL
jgi:hypothetical protein